MPPVVSRPQEGEEDDEYFTAHNTIVQPGQSSPFEGVKLRGGGGGRVRGGVIPAEDPKDGTITDLGTLVIIDDDDDDEEDESSTMKSEWRGRRRGLWALGRRSSVTQLPT